MKIEYYGNFKGQNLIKQRFGKLKATDKFSNRNLRRKETSVCKQ